MSAPTETTTARTLHPLVGLFVGEAKMAVYDYDTWVFSAFYELVLDIHDENSYPDDALTEADIFKEACQAMTAAMESGQTYSELGATDDQSDKALTNTKMLAEFREKFEPRHVAHMQIPDALERLSERLYTLTGDAEYKFRYEKINCRPRGFSCSDGLMTTEVWASTLADMQELQRLSESQDGWIDSVRTWLYTLVGVESDRDLNLAGIHQRMENLQVDTKSYAWVCEYVEHTDTILQRLRILSQGLTYVAKVAKDTTQNPTRTKMNLDWIKEGNYLWPLEQALASVGCATIRQVLEQNQMTAAEEASAKRDEAEEGDSGETD